MHRFTGGWSFRRCSTRSDQILWHGGEANGAAYMDGFVGNPPFMGRCANLRRHAADAYRDWLYKSA